MYIIAWWGWPVQEFWQTKKSIPVVFSDSEGSPYRDPLGRDPSGQWPLEGTWDQAARQEVTSYRDTAPVDRTTDKCKNISLPQTSFADGNNIMIWINSKVNFPKKLLCNWIKFYLPGSDKQ